MKMTDIIEKKRDKFPLSKEEIDFFISGVTDKTIPDYQISALLMAILLNGMTALETLNLTTAMAKSGDMLDLSDLEHTVDKHSTGGVGDKTTLIVAPIAAALGCNVAKMSGRGLGHTGGTVDKLESIEGYKTSLSIDEFKRIVRECGLSVIGQSGNFAPADKRLYALRDVTATVNSIPLIASSIMSKKLAAGSKTIVLDVKFGSGAFMKTPKASEELALSMVEIGKGAGRNVSALITDMDIPLGFAIGNSLEVKEALEVLNGKGPEDLREICIALAAQMYSTCFGESKEYARKKVLAVLENGEAFKKLCLSVKAHGGDQRLLTGEREFMSAPSLEVFSEYNGYISAMDTALLGKTASDCGAGRETLNDIIDPAAGIILNKKYGDLVKKGDLLATLYGEEQKIKAASKTLLSVFSFSDKKPETKPLIFKIIE